MEIGVGSIRSELFFSDVVLKVVKKFNLMDSLYLCGIRVTVR